MTASGADKAGLYSVAVTGGPAVTTVYGKTIPVGLLPSGQPVTACDREHEPDDQRFSPTRLRWLHCRRAWCRVRNPRGHAECGRLGGSDREYDRCRYAVRLLPALAEPAARCLWREARAGVRRPVFEDRASASGRLQALSTMSAATGSRRPFRRAAHTRCSCVTMHFPVIFPRPLRALIVQGGTQVGAVSGVGSSQISLGSWNCNVAYLRRTADSYVKQPVRTLVDLPCQGRSLSLNRRKVWAACFEPATSRSLRAGSYDLSLSDLQVPEGFGELCACADPGTPH